MNRAAVLLFALVVTGLMGCALAQAVVEESELDELEPVPKNDLEQQCIPTKSCGSDEEYRCCGPCYQQTCRGNAIPCDGTCFADCYCVKGFAREYPGGPCIPKLFCPLVGLPVLADYDEELSTEEVQE